MLFFIRAQRAIGYEISWFRGESRAKYRPTAGIWSFGELFGGDDSSILIMPGGLSLLGLHRMTTRCLVATLPGTG